jgi:hypothetical protein
MKKYRWSVTKALQFLYLKRPNLRISASVIKQLKDYERILAKSGIITNEWDEFYEEGKFFYQEVLLTNTYLNVVQNIQLEEESDREVENKTKKSSPSNLRVQWVDEE